MKDYKYQIHATNVTGLGASEVCLSMLMAFGKSAVIEETLVLLPSNGRLSDYHENEVHVKKYRRFLPTAVSRIIELVFSRWLFRNLPTVVLGDIPLNGIYNQIVMVHQPNLILPEVNKNSSRALRYRVLRFMFLINQRYAAKIIVQTGAMASDLISSYPILKNRIQVSPQPPPIWLETTLKIKKINQGKLVLFYPAASYPHKNHAFLFDINNYLSSISELNDDFEIWTTLSDNEFSIFKDLKFVKNFGRIPSSEMSRIYAEVNALLFMSDLESYGLPLVEALFLGLPIIVADYKYSRWMCEKAAYYYEPNNPKSFLEMKNVLKNDVKYNSSRTQHYKSAQSKFPKDWDNVIFDYVEFLRNCEIKP